MISVIILEAQQSKGSDRSWGLELLASGVLYLCSAKSIFSVSYWIVFLETLSSSNGRMITEKHNMSSAWMS